MRNRFFLALTAVCAAALFLPEAARAQEDIPTTVTVGQNRSLKVGAGQHGALKKGRVPPGWTMRDDHPNAQFLEVDGTSVGMAVSAGKEGKLNRVHVDAPAGSDLTVVIGFYDKIASQAAIDTQETYECKKCGRILVCSVRPQCAD
ncbi:MAG: hypothetical protein M8872_07440 [marine benthic group bacterium]|nr:hypothetical protein [Gemmatimonadota bacterium]